MSQMTVRREHYDQFCIDVHACVEIRRTHPECSKDAILEFYVASWGRQIDPQYFIAVVRMLERGKAAR